MTEELARRVRRLEDRAELTELVARYCVAIDDRDIDALAVLFTPDCSFRSRDGVMDAHGREAVMEQFRGRFSVLGPTNHFTHDRIFDIESEDAASGLVTSHAELVRNGRTQVVALRYEDRYRRHEGRWRFAGRLLSFLYYLPAEQYARGFASALRMRAYGDERPADYPEKLPTWRLYHDE